MKNGKMEMMKNMKGGNNYWKNIEECKKAFTTAAELRRHLTGTSKSGDKYGNCIYSHAKCKYCNYFDKRFIVEGLHYNNMHSNTYCSLCRSYIRNVFLREHYDMHKIQMQQLRYVVKEIEKKNNTQDSSEC